MSRVFQTGFETGNIGVLDIQPVGLVANTQVRGTWSKFALRGATNASPPIRSINGSFTEIFVGFGLLRTGSPVSNITRILSFTNSTGVEQSTLVFDKTASVFVFNKGSYSGSVIATGTTTFPVSTWKYIEMRFVCDATAGVITMKIDGITEFSLTGQVTKNAGTSTFDRLTLHGDSTMWMDDLVVNSTSGAQNNTYPGDTKVFAVAPTGPGAVTQLTASAGANWNTVDEVPPQTSDFVHSATVGQYDVYANGGVGITVNNIQATQLWLYASKSDAGAASIAPVLRQGSTESTGSDTALSTSWSYISTTYDVDPTDSGTWTTGKVNSLQFGPKVR